MSLLTYRCEYCKWLFDLNMRIGDPIHCPKCGEIWKSEKTFDEILEEIKKILPPPWFLGYKTTIKIDELFDELKNSRK